MKSSTIILSGAQCFVGGTFETCSLKIVNGLIHQIKKSIPADRGDKVLDLDGTVIVPGLINSHDHLEFNLFERIGTPPYSNYVSWGEDIHKHYSDYIRQVLRVPLRKRLLWGAYKNIFSGVTTVVHHNKFHFDFRFRYPVDVLRRYSWIHSLSLDNRLEQKLSLRDDAPCIIHLAEGVDELAATELSKLMTLGGLTKNTVIVHGVGLTQNDIGRIEEAGASLVWCPSSNAFLFHATAPIEHAFGRIRIALGTDSTLTGNASLFDEIRHAIASKHLDPLMVLSMVTSIPANIFGIDKGVIAEGRAADLLLFDCKETVAIDGFVGLDIANIKCLLRNGVPVYGDRSIIESFRVPHRHYTDIRVRKENKFVLGDLGRLIRGISRDIPSFDLNGLPIEFDIETEVRM